jgi:hypothetical protein
VRTCEGVTDKTPCTIAPGPPAFPPPPPPHIYTPMAVIPAGTVNVCEDPVNVKADAVVKL